jgi:hypothetical protein
VIETPKCEVLLNESGDGGIRLDVRHEDETVWLTQPPMAELYQTTQQNISQHVQNIYEEVELIEEATYKKFLSVRQEGNRQVKRNLDYYNLDMIIPVGYRMKSLIATRFRIWSNLAFRVRMSRNLPGLCRVVTMKSDSGRWWVEIAKSCARGNCLCLS